jgi:hypothetical protein
MKASQEQIALMRRGRNGLSIDEETFYSVEKCKFVPEIPSLPIANWEDCYRTRTLHDEFWTQDGRLWQKNHSVMTCLKYDHERNQMWVNGDARTRNADLKVPDDFGSTVCPFCGGLDNYHHSVCPKERK